MDARSRPFVIFYLSLILKLICFTSAGQIAQTNTAVMEGGGAFVVVSSGPHSRVWQMPAKSTNSDGTVYTNFLSYTELGTGLNHQIAGQWVPSTEEIQIQPDGSGAATNSQHQVYFTANINCQGSITHHPER
jgi:hypothetical protein